MWAVRFDFADLEDTSPGVALGAEAAPVIYRAMILYMLGYYLRLSPVALFLWLWLRAKDEGFVRLHILWGLAYIHDTDRAAVMF